MRILLATILLAVSMTSFAQSREGGGPPVKMARDGVCYVRGDDRYWHVRHFRPFPSLRACLRHGGRR